MNGILLLQVTIEWQHRTETYAYYKVMYNSRYMNKCTIVQIKFANLQINQL